jgi:hypothetical protein
MSKKQKVKKPHGNPKIAEYGAKSRFKKGDPRINKDGRPRKFVSALGAQFGYTQSQVHDAMRGLAAMELSELTDVVHSSRATALEVIVARAMIKARLSGDLHKIETVLTRAFGSPKQTVIQEELPKQDVTEIDWSKLSASALREIANAQIKKA